MPKEPHQFTIVIFVTKTQCAQRSTRYLKFTAASTSSPTTPADNFLEIKRLPDYTPARRLETESEVSAAIVFLLSPAAAFISGSCLRIDGAAPNAKRVWPEVGAGIAAPAFNGFHLARNPKVLKNQSE